MSDIHWKFFTRRPGAKLREPVHDEFFNNESIVDNMSAFIREVVQNVLDATRDKNCPAKVRFFVSGEAEALPPAVASPYLIGLWPHVQASMPTTNAREDQSCRFLVVEDFNTTGLRGDHTTHEEPPEDVINDFFYFFRAEGRSGKSGSARGRWGIGKFVLPRASEVRAIFGLTVRESNGHAAGPLLMGQAVARNHKTGGRLYEPDGWWSKIKEQVPVPLTDRDLIDEFRETWKVERFDDEPGLSVVIPFVDNDFRAEQIVQAVAEDYFIAILTDELVAVVENGDGETVNITHDGLKDIISRIPGSKGDELRAYATLVDSGLKLDDDKYLQVAEQKGAPSWHPELIATEERLRLKAQLDAGEVVGVRVPVHVGRKKGTPSDSYFDVLYQPEPGHRDKAIFAREGLIVPGVKCPVSGVRAVVLIRDEQLALMVGDAEGPAHVEWTARGTKFKGRYDHGRDWLAFIKRAPAEILRIVRGEDDDEDTSLAADLFCIPAEMYGPEVEDGHPDEPEPDAPSHPTDEDDEPGDDPDGPEPPPQRRIVVTPLEDGFAVELAGVGPAIPFVRITAAYDVRRGNPFKRWRPQDFMIGELDIDTRDGETIPEDGQTLVVRIDNQSDFALSVRGFDPNRDLKVQARRGGDR